MLYSCADWLTTDVTLSQAPASEYDDFDATYQPQHAYKAPSSVFTTKKQYSQPIKTPLKLPSSPSAVDDHHMRSPRSFEELQRGSLSLARSIEEFNAIIDADLSGECVPEGAAVGYDDALLSQLLGAHLFENCSYIAMPRSAVKYGWTPFDAGEFQFASVERDDTRGVQRHQW